MKKLILILVLMFVVNIGYSQTSNKVFSRSDSVSTSIDTLSRMDKVGIFNYMYNIFRQHYRFIIVPDSTIYLSTTSSFASDSTLIIKAGESYTSPLYDITVLNWYIKTKGTGKALVRKQLFGS